MGSVLGEGTEGRNDIIPLKSQKIKKIPDPIQKEWKMWLSEYTQSHNSRCD